jgi:hypothetical protein
MTTSVQLMIAALQAIAPGAQWYTTDGTGSYASIVWVDSVQAMPTQAAFTAAYAQQQTAAVIAYAAAKQQTIAAGGIKVNVGATQAPVNVEASTDSTSLVLLQGAYSLGLSAPATTFSWVQKSGVPVTLTAAQITTMFNAVTTFMQATFTTLAAVIAAIEAGGVTTTAQVDSFASPAWPANS